jgi:hypothetical protein
VVKQLTQFATANVVGVTKCGTHELESLAHVHVLDREPEQKRQLEGLRHRWENSDRKLYK